MSTVVLRYSLIIQHYRVYKCLHNRVIYFCTGKLHEKICLIDKDFMSGVSFLSWPFFKILDCNELGNWLLCIILLSVTVMNQNRATILK